MVIIAEYELVEKPLRGVFVISREKSICPCCGGALKCIGSRPRKYIDDAGVRRKMVIRRLYCTRCSKIHHELPDKLVPYRRHESGSVEAVIDTRDGLTVAADESTIRRWRVWFDRVAGYLAGCLESVANRYGLGPKPEGCRNPLERIKTQAGAGAGWLVRVVRTVVNMNLWIQTRSAFQTGQQ